MFHEYGYMVGAQIFWWLFGIALAIAVVLWGWSDAPRCRDRPRETPHELLRRRLANGDISTDEYEKRKVILDRDLA